MESIKTSYETIVYFILWGTAVFYSINSFRHQSFQYFSAYKDDYNDFESGHFFDYRKDIADLEWQTMLYLIKRIWLWIIFLLILSEKLRNICNSEVLQTVRVTFSVAFILIYLGPLALIAILAQPILMALIFNISSRKLVLWISNIIFISLISSYKYYVSSETFRYRFHLNDNENYLQILAIYWTNLRCFSFFMEQSNTKHKESFINLFSYCLYLPLLFNGPFIFYSNFKKSENASSSYPHRLLIILKNFTRFSFWAIFIEVSLHFFYVNATSFQTQLIESFDDWALYGYGYLMGQYFHIKYLVVYGFSTSIAMFEGIPVPSLPKCIGRIHLYSDMWKYFDNGLYQFLLRYIYIPMVDASHMNNKILASLMCFTFVYIWHGLESNIFIWVILNYIGIVIESLSNALYQRYLSCSRIEEVLGMGWMRRIKCFSASFLLAMSAISNFFFFSNISVGTIFTTRILKATLTSNVALILALYCCCQFSTELRNRLKKT